MKWALLTVGCVIALFAIVAAIGAMLPVVHHAARSAKYRQPPDVLYAVIAGAPDWRADVKAYGLLPDPNGRKQWWEQDTHNQKITYELLEDTPPTRRSVRIADAGLPFGGTWTFDISPAPGGSQVRIREDGEVYNVMFRFMARYIFGYTKTIEGVLRDLGAKFREQVSIEG
jgi:hypothetical protein